MNRQHFSYSIRRESRKQRGSEHRYSGPPNMAEGTFAWNGVEGSAKAPVHDEDGREWKKPAFAQPGQAPGTLTLTRRQGRTRRLRCCERRRYTMIAGVRRVGSNEIGHVVHGDEFSWPRIEDDPGARLANHRIRSPRFPVIGFREIAVASLLRRQASVQKFAVALIKPSGKFMPLPSHPSVKLQKISHDRSRWKPPVHHADALTGGA
jgi:hypothetical protein